MLAAGHRHAGVVHYLAGEHRANIEATNSNGVTSLMLAAAQGHAGAVRYLASEHGANTEATNTHGILPAQNRSRINTADP